MARQGLAALLAHSEISLAAAGTSPPLTTLATTSGAGRGETDTPDNTDGTESRHSRRRKSMGGGSGGGVGSSFGSGGGGGGATARSRRRRGRGFRDVEGEAIKVAAKVAELVRNKDMLEALRVVRLVQVSERIERHRLNDRRFIPCCVVLCFLYVLVCAPPCTSYSYQTTR